MENNIDHDKINFTLGGLRNSLEGLSNVLNMIKNNTDPAIQEEIKKQTGGKDIFSAASKDIQDAMKKIDNFNL